MAWWVKQPLKICIKPRPNIVLSLKRCKPLLHSILRGVLLEKRLCRGQSKIRLETPCRQESQVLVWFGSFLSSSTAPPEQSVQQLQAGPEASRQLPRAWRGRVETALQPSAAKWLPRATSRAGLSWPCLLQASHCCLLPTQPRAVGINLPTPQGAPSQAAPNPQCSPRPSWAAMRSLGAMEG